jgi:hypothetical protein
VRDELLVPVVPCMLLLRPRSRDVGVTSCTEVACGRLGHIDVTSTDVSISIWKIEELAQKETEGESKSAFGRTTATRICLTALEVRGVGERN